MTHSERAIARGASATLRMREVRHLIGAVLQVIAALQPAIVMVETVETYRNTGSAAVLRGWLRDAGYAIAEVVLDARDFGSLEGRVRWFLVACSPGPALHFEGLAAEVAARRCLANVREPIGPGDERLQRVDYLKSKAERDADSGKHFGTQLLTPASTPVPVLRKGYHKGGSTDPRLLHPSDPGRSRLLTAVEHARIKGIPPEIVTHLPETVAHQVCGQSVDVRPVQAIGQRIAKVLKAWSGSAEGPRTPVVCRAAMAPAVG